MDREAFSEADVHRLFSESIFTGHQPSNANKPGAHLEQSYVYWAYVLAICTGMRAAEIAQIRLDQIAEGQAELESLFFVDLRPYDASKGRVLMADLPKYKTANAARIILLHPKIIELGLGERVKTLRAKGHTKLFPDCRPTIVAGEIKWGHHISKDWQSRKGRVTDRPNVALHSLRHFAADLLDGLELPKRDRDRIMGHAPSDVGARYGRKATQNPAITKRILEAENPLMTWVFGHLHEAHEKARINGTLLRQWADLTVPITTSSKPLRA